MMFSKLFKHEMKATSRIFLIAWPALLLLALLNGFAMYRNRMYMFDRPGNIFAENILQVITSLAFVMVFIAVIVMTFVVVIMRFYKGLLKEEGYLTFTLPVTTREIIISKGLAATVIILAGGVVSALALLLWSLPMCLSGDMTWFDLGQLQRVLAYVDGWPLYALEGLVLIIVSVIASVYQIYAAMSLGQLAQKHKVAWSFAAYVGISIALSIIGSLLGMLFSIPGLDIGTYLVEKLVNTHTVAHIALLGYTLLQAIQLVAFHAITEYILDRKLNLE